MKKLTLVNYFILILLILSACTKTEIEDVQPIVTTPTPKPTPTTPPTSNYKLDSTFKIIAYMPNYRNPELIPDKKYKMLTHLIYAFVNPTTDESGNLQSIPNISRFEYLKQKAKQHNIKFSLSLGPGTGITENTYLNIAKNVASRTRFVTNIVNLAKQHELAGIDIDWEYPRTSNGGSEAFNLLMKELSEKLHAENMYLSAAVTPAVYVSTNRDAILQETFQYIDFLNIMQYDGPNYDKNEPLNHAPYSLSVASLNYWFSRSLPKVKAIVGIPLYGEDSSGKAKIYKDIEASGADVQLNIAKVDGIDYGFNGIPLVKQKTQLAKDRANGIMFWELGQDSETENSLIKAANDQLGRKYD